MKKLNAIKGAARDHRHDVVARLAFDDDVAGIEWRGTAGSSGTMMNETMIVAGAARIVAVKIWPSAFGMTSANMVA